MTPTHEFYAEHKQAWIASESIASQAEAERLNEIIGREFYRKIGATA